MDASAWPTDLSSEEGQVREGDNPIRPARMLGDAHGVVDARRDDNGSHAIVESYVAARPEPEEQLGLIDVGNRACHGARTHSLGEACDGGGMAETGAVVEVGNDLNSPSSHGKLEDVGALELPTDSDAATAKDTFVLVVVEEGVTCVRRPSADFQTGHDLHDTVFPAVFMEFAAALLLAVEAVRWMGGENHFSVCIDFTGAASGGSAQNPWLCAARIQLISI